MVFLVLMGWRSLTFGCKNIRCLMISDCGISGIDGLEECDNLEYVNIDECNLLCDMAARSVLAKCKRLRCVKWNGLDLL